VSECENLSWELFYSNALPVALVRNGAVARGPSLGQNPVVTPVPFSLFHPFRIPATADCQCADGVESPDGEPEAFHFPVRVGADFVVSREDKPAFTPCQSYLTQTFVGHSKERAPQSPIQLRDPIDHLSYFPLSLPRPGPRQPNKQLLLNHQVRISSESQRLLSGL